MTFISVLSDSSDIEDIGNGNLSLVVLCLTLWANILAFGPGSLLGIKAAQRLYVAVCFLGVNDGAVGPTDTHIASHPPEPGSIRHN